MLIEVLFQQDHLILLYLYPIPIIYFLTSENLFDCITLGNNVVVLSTNVFKRRVNSLDNLSKSIDDDAKRYEIHSFFFLNIFRTTNVFDNL